MFNKALMLINNKNAPISEHTITVGRLIIDPYYTLGYEPPYAGSLVPTASSWLGEIKGLYTDPEMHTTFLQTATNDYQESRICITRGDGSGVYAVVSPASVIDGVVSYFGSGVLFTNEDYGKSIPLTISIFGGSGEDLISFYDNAMLSERITEIKAPRGMTWEEFVNSPYVPMLDTDGSGYERRTYVIDGGRVMRKRIFPSHGVTDSYTYVTLTDYTEVLGSDLIIEGYTYTFMPCYLQGTLITLTGGSTKVVEDITYEDELLVWDFDNGCFASAKPLWIKKAQKATYYYRLKFDDCSEIGLVGQAGKCHRLFNIEKQEFISGTDFHVGEHTFNAEGNQVKLMSIEIVEDEVEYYNIITDYHMNCFANGLLTSTQYNNVYPIKDMKFVKNSRDAVPFESYEGIPKKFYAGMRLGEQDLSIRSVEMTNAYVGRMLGLMKLGDHSAGGAN